MNISAKRLSLLVCVAAAAFCLPVHAPLAAQRSATPGQFDFYLFTLSWAPQFCFTHGSSSECTSSGTIFVVHGLWPEYKNGSWPANCSQSPGPSMPESWSDPVPLNIIEHEWAKHGTCSGLSADDYFALTRRVHGSLTIPASLAHTNTRSSESPAAIGGAFVQSNPSLPASDLVIGGGGSSVDVGICLRKDGTPMNCPAIEDCHSSEIVVRSGRQ